jgi:hypothetical protein
MTISHALGDHLRIPFYDFREERGTWTIYERGSGRPAVLNGRPQTGLDLNEADELASALNRGRSSRQWSRHFGDD